MTFSHICSGGQAGADRAGLDWAIANGIWHGGWCPKGRKAEDGKISNDYLLRETTSAHYADRTEKNVLDSDGTAIFTLSPKLVQGSRLTMKMAEKHSKPWLHIHSHTPEPASLLAGFIRGHRISCLNVAGSRASREPTIGSFVRQILDQTLGFLLDREAGI